MDVQAIRDLIDGIESDLDEINDTAGSSEDPLDYEEEVASIDEKWASLKRILQGTSEPSEESNENTG